MKKFEIYTSGRNNNLNLLRFVLASLVIFTHSMGLTGNGDQEPLYHLTGQSFGSLAVDMFFVVSGFLIAKSWLSRQDLFRFFSARILRIYPGLLVCVLLSVLLLGPIFTSLPLLEYFLHIDTFKFAAENSTLIIKGVYPHLPGVFVGQGEGAVNASLWTLPFELKMYALLLLLGLVGFLRRYPVILLVACTAVSYGYFIVYGEPLLLSGAFSRFIFFFFAGSAIYLWRSSLVFSCYISLSCLLLFVVAVLFFDKTLAMLVLALITPYITLYLALVPSGKLQLFNRFGDYSYGLYIYGFPLQQVALALTGSALTGGGSLLVSSSWSVNFAIAWPLTLLCAVLSWHGIESIALKKHIDWANWLRLQFERCRKTLRNRSFGN